MRTTSQKVLNPGLYNAARVIEQRQTRLRLIHGTQFQDSQAHSDQYAAHAPDANVPRYRATEAWPPTASAEFPAKFEKPKLVRSLSFMNPAYYDYMQFRNFMRFYIFGFLLFIWYFHEKVMWIWTWHKVNSMQRVFDQTVFESRISWLSWAFWQIRVQRSSHFNAENSKVSAYDRNSLSREGDNIMCAENPMFIEIALRNREAARIAAES